MARTIIIQARPLPIAYTETGQRTVACHSISITETVRNLVGVIRTLLGAG